MDIRLTGTGGPAGWPEEGCGCAACARARRRGARRRPTGVVLDGSVRLPAGAADPPAGGGYRIDRIPGGLDVTAPDGGRLLLADGPAAPPQPSAGARPYHVALLDLAGDPAQLGLLRRRGLVTDETIVAPVHIGHQVRSEEELTRRCALWGAEILSDGSHVTAVPDGAARAPAGAGESTAPASPVSEHLPTTAAGPGEPWRVLLLGGARSGKSAEAELRLAAEPEVTYVATGPARDSDPDWAARVAAHRSRRPRWWRTEETLDLAGQLRAASGALLVDGIGTWLAGTMDDCGIWAALEEDGRAAADGRTGSGGPAGPGSVPGPGSAPGSAGAAASDQLAARVADLLAAWRNTRAHVVAVSDEAGSGVIPPTASGRMFRDELGRLNQLLAANCDEVALIVAGRAVPLPALSPLRTRTARQRRVRHPRSSAQVRRSPHAPLASDLSRRCDAILGGQ